MCGGGGGIIGGIMNAVFGKAEEPELPEVEPVQVPDVPASPGADEETRKAAEAARRRALAAQRRTQTVRTSDDGLGSSATTLKKKLGG